MEQREEDESFLTSKAVNTMKRLSLKQTALANLRRKFTVGAKWHAVGIRTLTSYTGGAGRGVSLSYLSGASAEETSELAQGDEEKLQNITVLPSGTKI